MRRWIVLAALLFSLDLQARSVIVFRAAGFPTVDAPPIAAAVLDRALAGLPASYTDDLTSLSPDDLLVLPCGSAFPLEAWPQIRTFLRAGGSLVVLGGAPFHQPILRGAGGDWELAPRQPSFAHDLLIGPADEVRVPATWSVALPDSTWTLPVNGAKSVWEMTIRLATTPNMQGEHGSEGNREGVVRPLVHLLDADGIPRACPLVEIDREKGRWIFAPTDAPLDATVIRAMVDRALLPPPSLVARPLQATVGAEETAIIAVNRRPATIVVRDHTGRQVLKTRSDAAEVRIDRKLAPGLYHVEVTAGAERTTTGFWVRNEALLRSGPRLSVSRDWIRRDGRVFPIVGTTYMASDVHRQFLFEPNPHLWDRDFARMQTLGVNFVRTGIWTAWPRAMAANGTPDEAVLRALEAYVQAAAKHDIIVTFTFFAFLPPSFGGTNPYLDPKSIEGQKRFVAGIARRFKGSGWINYDLINEPSYAPPEGLWSNRPIGDEWERRAWAEWVRARHGEGAARLAAEWGVAGDDLLAMPRLDEVWPSQLREQRSPQKVRDFVEFSHEVVAKWAATLRSAIREEAGDVLVTVGQDEGGTGTRPSQQLHAAAVDYTCIHPWWQNDDVLANGVLAKVPEKPSLFQETGLMRLEEARGNAWRSPEIAASTLGRKFASAFAARSAGALEWAWNINPYMPIDNESTIGFFRPDGTAKPELDVVPQLAKFFSAAAPWLDDFEPDRVIVVIPQGRLFMNRPAALDGTRRLIRLMAERFGIVPGAISDLRLTPERLSDARLVIVPSAEFIDRAAADALLAAKKNGSRILFTGAVTGDSYGNIPEALKDLDAISETRPVQYREPTPWTAGPATFDRGLQESLLRRVNGDAWHEPLPLEHAREDEPLIALLTSALQQAGIDTQPTPQPLTTRLLFAPRAVLGVFINDTADDTMRKITIAGRTHEIRLAGSGMRLLLFDRTTGEIRVDTEKP